MSSQTEARSLTVGMSIDFIRVEGEPAVTLKSMENITTILFYRHTSEGLIVGYRNRLSATLKPTQKMSVR